MLKELKAELQKFGHSVVNGSVNQLTGNNHVASGELAKNISYEIKENVDGFDIEFWMDEYGMFLDAGVYGSNPMKARSKNPKQKGKKTNSVFTGKEGLAEKFSYKNKRPPMESLRKWAKKKNIRFRDKKGRYAKGSYTTIAFWLQDRIFHQGIAPTLFFTKPFLAAFKNLDEEIVKAFDLYINTVLKEDK
tara:strand:- start:42 stop:611 length:570 start_codon:yes stop_codon:yes gene_type:complete